MPATALTGLEKVAVLLKSMPPEVQEKVMRRLDARHAGLVRAELAKLDQQKDLGKKISHVLDEAVNVLRPDGRALSTIDISVDGKDTKASEAPPKPVKTASAGQPPPQQPAVVIEEGGDPLRALAAISSDLLALALDSENTRTASLLMNSLDIKVATQIYKRLSPGKRKEVSLRFTEQALVGDELLRRIARGVLRKCQTLQEASASNPTDQGGRETRIAALLRGLERAERAEMVAVLEATDAELTGRVKSMLYQFEDILRMENISVQKFLSEVDIKTLSLALRGAPEEIEAKILANLSKRAQDSLREEISLTGSVPPPKVKAARQSLVEAIQRLDQRGELVINE